MQYRVEGEDDEQHKFEVINFKIVNNNEEGKTKHWVAIVTVITYSIAFLGSLFLGFMSGNYDHFDKVIKIISYPMVGLLFYYFGVRNINLDD